MIKPVDRFELFPIDKHSPLWGRLKADYIERRLSDLRSRNDGDLNEIETANLRGRIAELKALLALDSERPQVS